MTKTTLKDGSRQVGVRLPEDVCTAVEKHLVKMRKEAAPGIDLKLADALRNLISIGLEAASK